MGSPIAKISNVFGMLGVFGGIWMIWDGVFGILDGVFADQQGAIYKRGRGDLSRDVTVARYQMFLVFGMLYLVF